MKPVGKMTFLWPKIGLGFGELGAHTPTKNSRSTSRALFRLEAFRNSKTA